jgi:hypothetical protein
MPPLGILLQARDHVCIEVVIELVSLIALTKISSSKLFVNLALGNRNYGSMPWASSKSVRTIHLIQYVRAIVAAQLFGNMPFL